jgi:UDP-N-acetyl-D-glucosamine dehydrogenase
MQIDLWEVVEAAASKPYGFMRFDPGPGMGGHCLPVDPFYLAFKAREYDFPAEFIELAGKVNQQQPHYCVDRVARALNDAGKAVRGSRVLLLGVSYKANVGDMREAPSLKIAHLLREHGAEVSYHDKHVPELAELGISSVALDDELGSCDIACVITAHKDIDFERVVAEAPLVLDFRGATRGISAANVVRL